MLSHILAYDSITMMITLPELRCCDTESLLRTLTWPIVARKCVADFSELGCTGYMWFGVCGRLSLKKKFPCGRDV